MLEQTICELSKGIWDLTLDHIFCELNAWDLTAHPYICIYIYI